MLQLSSNLVFFSKMKKLSQYRKNSFAIFPIVGLHIEKAMFFICCNPLIFLLEKLCFSNKKIELNNYL